MYSGYIPKITKILKKIEERKREKEKDRKKEERWEIGVVLVGKTSIL